jgi:hypothetical protein
MGRIKPMLQSSVEGDPGKDATMLAISISRAGSSGRHAHPGDCYGTAVEGASSCASTLRAFAGSRPARPGTIRAGWYTS